MGVKIKDIPIKERPCERLVSNGVENLSTEELISIILKTGTKGISAKDLSEEILSKVGNVKKLNDITYENLRKIKGIGMVKACNLIAAIELGKRINREIDTLSNIKLSNTETVYKFYKDRIGEKKQEHFYAIYLDNQKRIIKDKLLFIGTINYSTIHPREIFKEAYIEGATGIICVHNHPGGNPLPSKQDYDVTNNLIEVGKILGIKLVDHVIICKNNYYSFFENNDISF